MKEVPTFTTTLPGSGLHAIKKELVTPGVSKPVIEILKSRVCDPDAESAFYVANLASVERQYHQWTSFLPRVRPFYAMKCNPDVQVAKTLFDLGTGFDCASMVEIKMALDLGAKPESIIFANPCKQISHIKYAASEGIKRMTFDNVDELYKIKLHYPQAQMVLRILTDDSKSICRFGIKFGASMAMVPTLLAAARSLDINVIGISFHVGSGCFDASSFKDAVFLARKAFDIGEALGFDFNFLDLGGGFPGRTPTGLQFKTIANLIGPVIDELFPSNVQVIAEPGRYFVSNAYTLAVNIMARRVVSQETAPKLEGVEPEMGQKPPTKDDQPSFMYYINDGMYGSFNCITFDHAICDAKPLFRNGRFGKEIPDDLSVYHCSIWGPTCDSIDCITRAAFLPEMNIGDWLYFENMGAYTMAAASTFNGFNKSDITYTYE